MVNVTLEQGAANNCWPKDITQPPVDIAVHADVDKFAEELLNATSETASTNTTSPAADHDHNHAANQQPIPEAKPLKIRTGRNSTSSSRGMGAHTSSPLRKRRASGSSQSSPLSLLTPMGIAISTLKMRDTPQITLRGLALAFYKVPTPASISFLRLPLT